VRLIGANAGQARVSLADTLRSWRDLTAPPGATAQTRYPAVVDWGMRILGIAIAGVSVAALERTRRRPDFVGKRRVEIIALAFVVTGLLVVLASFQVPPNI
jgi:hypothetical protein